MVFAGIDSSDGVGGVVPCGGRRPPRTSVPLVRREDRARHGEPDRPRPAHQRDRLRRARGTAPGDHRRDPGARRAALPVAQGDHGGTQQGDRHEVARRISGWMRRGWVAPARPPRCSTAGSHRPGLRRRSCAGPRPRQPSASSTSWPSGGSSDGRAVGRRRTRCRRRHRPGERRGRHARPRAGRVDGPRRDRHRHRGGPGARGEGTGHVPPGRLGDHRTRGGGARLVGGRGRPHRGPRRRVRSTGRDLRRGRCRRSRPRRRRLGTDRSRRPGQCHRGQLGPTLARRSR